MACGNYKQQTSGLIEYFEHTLVRQDNIDPAILWYHLPFPESLPSYIYTMESVFAHHLSTKKQPGTTCAGVEQWWIETWQIEHCCLNKANVHFLCADIFRLQFIRRICCIG